MTGKTPKKDPPEPEPPESEKLMDQEEQLLHRIDHLEGAMDNLADIRRAVARLESDPENPVSQKEMAKLRTGSSAAEHSLSELNDDLQDRKEDLADVRERLAELEDQDDAS
jgi:septal ring factor EnvC (AmiA/AmiB activator)